MEQVRCPECGAILPPDVPAEQCPSCLMQLGLKAADPLDDPSSAERVGLELETAVDGRVDSDGLRRLLAFTELRFSNSMIEAWWRSMRHQWLYLHPLDSVATIRRLVAFYAHEHNHVLPHSAFRGQTPDEMYVGTAEAVPGDLTSRAAAARRARLEANRSRSCTTCPSLSAA